MSSSGGDGDENVRPSGTLYSKLTDSIDATDDNALKAGEKGDADGSASVAYSEYEPSSDTLNYLVNNDASR